ncbi:MAG: pantetheine-phosphate adenylyltransferase [Candidatus Aureabacteria bacterium]|nr:pantetheine-phosphate adenylyltransferase [Candidatus Auribacterota bacterium]
MRAIYPGTFDPVTYGHLDIIKRSSAIFDELIVAVAANEMKRPFFSLEERVELLRKSFLLPMSGVEICSFHELLIDFARKKKAKVVLRGLRAVSDFEFEFQMALMNKKMNPDIETFFMMPDETFSYLSSKGIKEIISLGGNISAFVPAVVEEAFKKKYDAIPPQ